MRVLGTTALAGGALPDLLLALGTVGARGGGDLELAFNRDAGGGWDGCTGCTGVACLVARSTSSMYLRTNSVCNCPDFSNASR